MKKVLKVAGIAVFVIIIIAFAALKYLSSRPAAPGDYQKTTETGSALEAKYMSSGAFAVSVYEEPALQVFKKYVIYYPSSRKPRKSSIP